LNRISFRRYTNTDHDVVWSLHNLALNTAEAHGGNGPWDDDLHHIEEIYLKNGGEFIVAEYERRIVGMGALKRRDDTHADITRMRIHPDFQRQGIGQSILSRLEEAAGRIGYRTLTLDTTAGQIPARRLYEKNGYTEFKRTHYKQFEVILYEKKLTSPPVETRRLK
jgi:ribosomal protein S18 acetylase RimI-like enzyme